MSPLPPPSTPQISAFNDVLLLYWMSYKPFFLTVYESDKNTCNCNAENTQNYHYFLFHYWNLRPNFPWSISIKISIKWALCSFFQSVSAFFLSASFWALINVWKPGWPDLLQMHQCIFLHMSEWSPVRINIYLGPVKTNDSVNGLWMQIYLNIRYQDGSGLKETGKQTTVKVTTLENFALMKINPYGL